MRPSALSSVASSWSSLINSTWLGTAMSEARALPGPRYDSCMRTGRSL